MTSLKVLPLVLVILTAGAMAQIRVIAAGSGVSQSEVDAVTALADDGVKRLAPYFPGVPKRSIRIFLHASADELPPTLRASLHPGVPGFALLQRDQIHLVMADIKIDPPNDLRTTVDHELVHILLDQYVGRNGAYVARWFHEGLAQVLAGDGYLGVQEEDLISRVRSRTYIPFRLLDKGFPKDRPQRLALAYGQSYSFVAFLRRTVGLETLLAAAKGCGPDTRFKFAFATLLNEALVVHEDRWLVYLVDESGAGFRVLLRNSFFILLVLFGGPLLALAVARRRNREERIKHRLGEQDRVEDRVFIDAEAERLRFDREEAVFGPPYHPDSHGGVEPDSDDVEWDDWQTAPDDPDYQGRPADDDPDDR